MNFILLLPLLNLNRVSMSKNHFSNVTCVRQQLIPPPNITYPLAAGHSVSHGQNGHLQTSTRLPRDSSIIAPSMIRYPVQLSAPTSVSASGSLSSRSEKQECWSSDRWASTSVTQTASGVSGFVAHSLLSRRWRFTAAFSRCICSRSSFLNAQSRWVLGLLGFDI
jgi:hypothetical protein